MNIHLYNSLTRTKQEFTPIDGSSTIRMYTCGPTVYNVAHIGNMRAFLFPDILQRVLKVVCGYSVRWVMNITDIEDKIILGSAVGSSSWPSVLGEQSTDARDNARRFTEYYAKLFLEDIATLGIVTENFEALPRATEYITEMQYLIRTIAEKGFAYERDGSVYFNVGKWRYADTYGKLFTIDFENFREGVRIDADEYERESVSDFVLWKAKKDGEPAWDFDFEGKNLVGRPGWHIECSAMEKVLLGLPFDIHTGGVDLKFPHHEDEIAQSKAGYGVEPTAFWCHNEFLEVEGEKMSKSKGNYFTVRDLLAKGLDPLDIRYLMISAHYATKMNFTFAGLEAGSKARKRIQEIIWSLLEQNISSSKEFYLEKITQLRSAVFAHLADDLNTPKALAELFTFINRTPIADLTISEKSELLGFLQEFNQIFAVWTFSPRPEEKLEIPAEVLRLAEERYAAKKAKNFGEADRLRSEIAVYGFAVKDTKEGFTLEKQ